MENYCLNCGNEYETIKQSDYNSETFCSKGCEDYFTRVAEESNAELAFINEMNEKGWGR